MSYSEFYTVEPRYVVNKEVHCCDRCGLTHRYQHALDKEVNGECGFCKSFEEPVQKGLDKIKDDVCLHDHEKIGVSVSGGKDSIYMWGQLVDLFGKDNVVAYTHVKEGLVDPIASSNLKSAEQILGSKLVRIYDDQMFDRFKENLALLLKNPKAELVRVVLCAGCRGGISKNIYDKANKEEGITKFFSGASSIELAPFKEELIEKAGNGDSDKGLENLLEGCKEYDKDRDLILLEHHLKYKSNNNELSGVRKNNSQYELFDFDSYQLLKPEQVESYVMEHYNWHRNERSWHFDCIVEEVKDMFYYGILGFSESDFKLSHMVRMNMITKEEAEKQKQIIRYNMRHSYSKMEQFLMDIGLEDSIEDLKKFYNNSPYLKGGI